MKKQFLRVKQIADQTFLRAEKTEVLPEDLVIAEKRVETIRVSCQTTQKKITSCNIDFGNETAVEKRLKKIPQITLGASMLENGNNFSKNSVLGDTLRECANVQTKLGNELLEYYNEVEKTVLKPISGVLDNEIHNINKLRKQLGKLVLDMDSARTRFQTAERHSLQTSSNSSVNAMVKVDTLKDELEDASQKVDQCRDALATEMFSLISKEPQLAHLFVHFHQLQANYHRNALAALEASLPQMENHISDFPQKPVYGCSLEEHLRVTNREIAQVIETCVLFLLEYGVLEEGLFRIAGSASKLKKLKSAFDAGVEIDMTEFLRDPHAVSGALKSYLRELPEPLMTFSLYDEWINAAKIQEFDSRLQALWQVLHKLPDANFKNLQYLIKFLSKLHENVDVNKMSSQNIAIVIAPNLIWPPSEETSATFGMNMSAASLHTTIVDMLISYADWFFPGNEIPMASKMSPGISNLNENAENLEDSFGTEGEINGNTLQVINDAGNESSSSCSPRTLHKAIKKPAAPPPPAQKSVNCDKNLSEDIIPTGELIDFSGDDDAVTKISDLVEKQPIPSKEKTDKSAFSTVVCRKSNENITINDQVSVKFEKPVIPDKPLYSSCSLDRRNQRQLSTRVSSDKMMEVMSRSHIERPTVPPPERPAKPPKYSSSSENLSVTDIRNNPRKGSGDEDNSSLSPKSAQLSPSGSCTDNQDDSNLVPTSNTVKTDHSQTPLQHSRSSSKVNRFDFLINQNVDKPPERPPRSVGPNPEHSEKLPIIHDANPKSDVSQPIPTIISVKVTSSETAPPPVPPVSPRALDAEKTKPPRPQPPAKPKLNAANENTSL